MDKPYIKYNHLKLELIVVVCIRFYNLIGFNLVDYIEKLSGFPVVRHATLIYIYQ